MSTWCSQSPFLREVAWGPDLVLQGGTWAHSTLLVAVGVDGCVCVCVCARARTPVHCSGPLPAYTGGAVGCLHVCARNHTRCYVHAKLYALCVMYAQCNGVEEQCSPLFLPERKSELSGAGVQLLGWAGTSWAHIPPARPLCPAESSIAQHRHPAPQDL